MSTDNQYLCRAHSSGRIFRRRILVAEFSVGQIAVVEFLSNHIATDLLYLDREQPDHLPARLQLLGHLRIRAGNHLLKSQLPISVKNR